MLSSTRHNDMLQDTARDTMSIVAAGGYRAANGVRVNIAASIKAAISGTRTFMPKELDLLLDAEAKGPSASLAISPRSVQIQVTLETTQQAAYRLFVEEKVADLALLNFASAIHAGGGFLRGAKAQEEDLARCSSLFSCLQTQTEFYAFHRMAGSDFYSDRMIYSPRVPFFRLHSEDLLSQVYEASVITAAAPNAGRLLGAGASREEVEGIYRRRTGKVLALAEAGGHRSLVLGAWGCGVFGNDPEMAADSFGRWIEGTRFRDSFDRVVFAVYDARPQKPSYTSFLKRFEGIR